MMKTRAKTEISADKKPEAKKMKTLVERVKGKGASSLSDYDLISLVVKETDDEYLSNARLAEAVDVSKNLFNDLLEIRGVNERKACSIIACLELGRRIYGIRSNKIKTASDAYPLLQHFADRKQEQFIVISLNGAHEVIETRVVTIGILNRTIVHPREVFADPITDRAAAIIVAHNHPSGQLEPSEEDIIITKRLAEVGELVGITLLDHLILSSKGGYSSFVESNISFSR